MKILLNLVFLFLSGAAVASGMPEGEAVEVVKGPHGGRLLESEALTVELSIVDKGIPPEFRAWVTRDGEPVSADQVDLTVTLNRLGGMTETFDFAPEGAYLRGLGVVYEPHSFDVRVEARAAGERASWQYENYEGRTTIPARVAMEAGVATEAAGPRTIREVIKVTGTVQANPARLANVRPRYPGVIREINVDIDQEVSAGQQLGVIETNDSLRRVAITAPIAGLVVNRDAQLGQVTGAEPLFTIVDLSEVWVILDIFGSRVKDVRSGMPVEIMTMQGDRLTGEIDHVSPLMAHGSQSAHARVSLDNSAGLLRSGQFVEGHIILDEAEVPVAVARTALQTFRDFTVVYARVDETYEVRMLDLGRQDDAYVEVLSGLRPGEVYVAANSYLIKADIEKDGASHDH